jgi:hypothetical protein
MKKEDDLATQWEHLLHIRRGLKGRHEEHNAHPSQRERKTVQQETAVGATLAAGDNCGEI